MYRIYIAEDDEGIARAISKGLSGWELDTRCATDFRHITDEIAEYQPHLVLMDITLPFCNGRADMKASGIGLYLCRRICRALGHTISAESSGSGTTVSIGLGRNRVDLRE